MDIEITPERRSYFEARGKIILNACPGSGKTTCIVYKMLLLEQECRLKFGMHAGIACLSFTNIAKQEILDKYKKTHQRELHYPHKVATIDSFINKYITLPFYNLLNPNFNRPKIVDEDIVIDKLFKIQYRDKKGVLSEGFIPSLLKFKDNSGKFLCHIYPPNSIWIGVDGLYSFKGKKPDSRKVNPILFQKYGEAIFEYKLKKGLISSLDSSYIALILITKYEQIGKYLMKRFPYIIIDEAQDNSEIQHAIFDKLAELGLQNIEMIGDPYQSLYEWRDAKPDLFLKKFISPAWQGLTLSQNRRSVQHIIDCFSIIRKAGDESILSKDVDNLALPVRIYKYTSTNIAEIVQHFEETCNRYHFKDNRIVSRGIAFIKKMQGAHDEIDPWKTLYPSRLLEIRHNFECNKIKEAVDELRGCIIELIHPDLDYAEIKDLQKEKEKDYAFNGKLYDFLYSIPSTFISFLDWTADTINKLNEGFEIDASNFFVFKQKIKGYKMADLKKENVNQYFNKLSSVKYNIPITTIHKVKGVTLDAILYFFNADSNGQSVSFNDFKPSTQFPQEKQRIIYVACSRPKQLLALAFPSTITDTDLLRKFGTNIEMITL